MSAGRYSPRSRGPWRPRKSRARRYLEYALTLAALLVLLVVVDRINRGETRRLSGEAIVNDGDTITVKGERLRLRGIDAPEFSQTCQRNGASYACGRESSRSLGVLVRSGALHCDGWERDKFDRLLVVCRAGDVDINRRQVENGWAVAYGDYADAERAARQAKRGLWAGEFERPRDFRDRHGHEAESAHDWFATINERFATIVNWLRQTIGW